MRHHRNYSVSPPITPLRRDYWCVFTSEGEFQRHNIAIPPMHYRSANAPEDRAARRRVYGRCAGAPETP